MATEPRLHEKEQPIRVLIADGHKLVRQGLRMIIEARPDMTVVGEAGDFQDALDMTRREQPEIILLDLDLAGGRFDVTSQLICSCRKTRIIVLVSGSDPDVSREAVRRGAVGVVTKYQSADVLIRAIECVHAGEAWLDHKMTARVISEISRPRKHDEEAAKIASLTNREREIITVVCEGLKNRQIAEQLFISEATVRNHLTSILSKLNLSDRFELAIYCYRHALAQPPIPESLDPIQEPQVASSQTFVAFSRSK